MGNTDILFSEINIPLIYLAIYVAVITLVAILNRIEFLLIVSYVSILYMGYSYNYTLIRETLGAHRTYDILYIVFGLVTGILTLIAALLFLFKRD